MLNLLSCVLQAIQSPDTRILLNADSSVGRDNETINIRYSDSGGTNFSFVTHMSIPIYRAQTPLLIYVPELAFSADGSKFAMAMRHGGVLVWDIQSKVPLKTFVGVPKLDHHAQPVKYLQFSSGNLGKEALVFVEVCLMFPF